MAFENIYTGFQPGGVVDTHASSGDILGNLAAGLSAGFGAGGNLLGNYINYRFNRKLQENQMENQIELQNRAFQHNQIAVQQQARLQALGKQQAGLSAADVSGQGAPSLQAGAAAGASSSMSNVFSGIADLIAAIKAPTEIEKAVAETELTRAGVPKVGAETEEIQHRNADWTSYNDFVREHGPAMFAKEKEALMNSIVDEETGKSLWDLLDEDTQNTYDNIISGDIPITKGSMQAILDDVELQAKLPEAEYRKISSMAHAGILIEKLQDKEAVRALLDEEKNEVKKLKQDIKESKSRSTANYANARNANAEANRKELTMPTKKQAQQLVAADVKMLQTEVAEKIQNMDQKALQDFQYLWDKGRYADALGRLSINATQEVINIVKSIVPAALAARGMAKIGRQLPVAPHPTREGGNAMSIQEYMRQERNLNDPSRLQNFW